MQHVHMSKRNSLSARCYATASMYNGEHGAFHYIHFFNFANLENEQKKEKFLIKSESTPR